MGELSDKLASVEYWEECLRRVRPTDTFGAFLILGQIKRLKREKEMAGDTNNTKEVAMVCLAQAQVITEMRMLARRACWVLARAEAALREARYPNTADECLEVAGLLSAILDKTGEL